MRHYTKNQMDHFRQQLQLLILGKGLTRKELSRNLYRGEQTIQEWITKLVIAINLNSRLVEQEKTIKDMQWTVQEHELSIQRLAEQNTAQEVIINKLNREYQVQERKKAEAVKEAAEMNNVGG
jgi:hypothetical protein|uniref:Regulatory protein n=1 Tax=Siphoviridae sp. ctt0Q14 TaxID=2826489 RepID=A0A8S5QW88_9CAUD|nr:MAG TPA: regulatory protein [Siphoviridae sp. ctt0Q14]